MPENMNETNAFNASGMFSRPPQTRLIFSWTKFDLNFCLDDLIL